jgi:hypothetical protein
VGNASWAARFDPDQGTTLRPDDNDGEQDGVPAMKAADVMVSNVITGRESAINPHS